MDQEMSISELICLIVLMNNLVKLYKTPMANSVLVNIMSLINLYQGQALGIQSSTCHSPADCSMFWQQTQ